MEEIKQQDGKITIPEKFAISETKRNLTIRMPWVCEIHKLGKGNFQESIQTYFRSKSQGQKPYVPEGFVEFDGIRFKVI